MKVILHSEVTSDLKKMPLAISKEAKKMIQKLEKNPFLGQKLVRELQGARKLYFNQANHRIVYIINNQEVHVLVIAIAARKNSEVYKIAKKRMQRL